MNILSNIIPSFLNSITNFPRREVISFAYLSIEKIFGFSKSDCIVNSKKVLTNENINQLNKIIGDLKKNIPIQYILGETTFCGLKFNVNNSTLIPRNETEELVNLILNYKFNSLLDIGTGSGCIAISVAKKTASSVSAIDISHQAISIAKKNAITNNVSVDFRVADIFNFDDKRKYDIIVSNPPYVCESEKQNLHKNVVDYEPHLALFVKDSNPLIFYKRIAQYALTNLNKKGHLFFEINEKYSNQIIEMLVDLNFVEIELKKDINDRNRIIKSSIK